MSTNSPFREAGPSAVVDRRYMAKREIARGAMGVVLEAQHQTLRTTVALKTLTTHALDWRGGCERLMREGRALALCRHPHIVAVYDAGTCDIHGPFLALEMLEGRTLGSILVARQRLTVPQVARIAKQLGDALDHVHQRGVVHRDIKPTNVLVVRGAGGDSSLRLLDFGIASVPDEEDVVDHKLTKVGEVLGTPEYIAPEHLLDGAPSSVLSDVYGLGVLLYECLVGDVPYVGRPSAILTALIAGAKPRPFTSVRDDVPLAFQQAIFAALSRDPARRPSSVAELVQACTAAVSERPEALDLLGAAAAAPAQQREFARVPYVAPARMFHGQHYSDGRTEDISEGGLLVIADTPVANGERVQVKIPLPSGGRVATIDTVARWSKSQRGRCAIGLAFESLAPEALADIRTYIRHMTSGRDVARAPTEWGGAA